MKRLYDRLAEYNQSDYYGFHMPGHKRNTMITGAKLPYELDITEIDGFDDLHHAEGILKEAQQRAALLYGAEETRFLVNGSTVGILSGILGNTNQGDTILVARHCHKSIYHAMDINQLRAVYLYPEYQGESGLNTQIIVEDVRNALEEHPEIRAVVIVSPTYDGVISDIAGIAEVVHKKEIPLIVDEAHGAHLGFHSYFGENALAKGADVVIHSVHKTMPSLTQTALLHVQGKFANRKRMYRYLDMLQSSSPSYVLMASIDACVGLMEEQGMKLFEIYVERLERLRKNLRQLKVLRILETEDFDKSKFVISTGESGWTGKELYQKLLDDFQLQMEMAAGTYVIAMTSIADTEEGFRRLEEALFSIDQELEKLTEQKQVEDWENLGRLPRNSNGIRIFEAMLKSEDQNELEAVPYEKAINRISAEYAYLYPPGIPLVVAGERVASETIDLLVQYKDLGYTLEGLHKQGEITVFKEES